MANTHLAGLVLAATILLTTAGCGKSSTKPSSTAKASAGAEQPVSTSPSGTKSSSRAQFIATADAICLRLSTQSATVKIKTRQDIARTAPRLVAYEKTALAELRKLTPPQDIASDWKAILSDLQAVTREVTAMGRYAGRNDLVSLEKANVNTGNIQRHRIAIAARNHMTGCSSI